MDNTQHTSGRWSRNIKPASKYNTIFAGRNTHICYLNRQGLTENEIEGNCNLITAAPDLLEACETALENLAPKYAGDHIVVKRLRAAITKAKGNTS